MRITPYDCCSGVEVDETERAGAGTDPGIVDEIPGTGPPVPFSDPPFPIGFTFISHKPRSN